MRPRAASRAFASTAGRARASTRRDPTGDGGEKSTGANEPLIWWIPYGKGKVFTCLLGHVGRNGPDLTAMRCMGFVTAVTRGAEWVATGEVTLPFPDNFPTESKTSLADE